LTGEPNGLNDDRCGKTLVMTTISVMKDHEAELTFIEKGQNVNLTVLAVDQQN
jgi:hypothetical protein